MESHHEENMECPCPCHGSGGTCSTCASTGCKMKGGMGGSINPIEIGAIMWQKAFFKANMELMAEKLKKRMEARWGQATDKAADALIDKMEKQWMAMFQQTGAEQEFREKLAKIYSEGQKK
jgi:ferredoxin